MDTHDRNSLISQTHAGAQTVAFMYRLAEGSTLGQRTRLRIAIYLAQRGRCAFPMASLLECGRAEGMNGDEMAANQQGTSHDARDTVCLRFVQALVDDPAAPSGLDTGRMREAHYTEAEILDVMAQVEINALLARMNTVIASPGAIEHCGQADSRNLRAD